MTYEIVLLGEVVASKNEKMAVMRKRKSDTAKGVAGSHYAGIALKPAAKESMDRIAMQIPGELRDLKLRHPRIEFNFVVGRINVDRDNIVSTVLDLLVLYGVMENDSVASCNNMIVIHPAHLRPDEWETRIVLEVFDLKSGR